MRICIVGAGAIGGLTGAWFARAGHEVGLVARGAHLEALRRDGLTLVSGGRRETFRMRASAEPADFGVQDAVLICLKAYSIAPMLPRLKAMVGPETMVVPAINGLPWWYFYREGGRFDGATIDCLDPRSEMFAALDPKHIIGCVVHGAAEVAEPGVITHTGGNRFVVGEPDRSASARVQRLAAAMNAAGFDTPIAQDIRVEVWTKLVGNLSYNPVAALTLAHMQEINRNAGLLALIRALIEESMRVAEAYGARMPMTVEERIGITKKLGNSRISMHQDIDRRRPLEIDAIVGAVVELARKAGIATPMIDLVQALIAERASHLDR
ncbi:MAG: 2-dehydropantoate 2-reductase [Burkholderiales bacterium]